MYDHKAPCQENLKVGTAQGNAPDRYCSEDLAMAMLAHYEAYIFGRYEGSKPIILQLKNIFLSGKDYALHTKKC